MDDNTNPLRTTPSLPPRSGGVVVKGLEWESRVAWRWTAASLVGNYEVDADSATPGEEFIWSLDREYGGYASTVPAAKAAAQADYEARIRSTLADPIPEDPADEEVASAIAAEVMGNDHLRHLLDEQQCEEVHGDVQEIVLRALRRSTKTDKPGVREAALTALDEARAYGGTITPLVPLSTLTAQAAALVAAERERDEAWSDLSKVAGAIGSVRFMDPPDGGDVTLAEQVARMREALEAAEARVAELEAGLEPFAGAAECIEDTTPDGTDMWEHPAAMSVTAADFRRARRLTEEKSNV